MIRDFTSVEAAVLRIVQADLPDSLTPFADIAREAGTTEDEVLALLRALKEEGVIRRFGASIKHQKAGWSSNAMVAWICPESEADAIGRAAAGHPHVSHCYFRPSKAEDWPFELYTMVHGRNPGECEAVIAELQERLGLREYRVLSSLRELKKISPTYF